MSSNRVSVYVEALGEEKASAAFKGLAEDTRNFAASVDKSEQSGLRLRDVFAGNLLADFFKRGTSAALEFSANAVRAVAAAEDANRVLEASATQAGLSYSEAATRAEDFGKRAGLSVTEANRTYAELIRLASQAGRTDDLENIGSRFLDLAAARGIKARELGTIAQQIAAGTSDEALNKLGLADPGRLYQDYAKQLSAIPGAAHRAAESLTEIEKAQARLNPLLVQAEIHYGANADRLNSTAGRLDTLAANYDNLTTAIGQSITASGIFNDILTGTLQIVETFSITGQKQIVDAKTAADEAVESTAGKLITNIRQASILIYGAGEFLLGVVKTALSFVEDLGKVDPLFGKQGFFGSEKFFQGTREGLSELNRISKEGKEALYYAEERLREDTFKQTVANNARILAQEQRANEQKVRQAEQSAKQIAATQVATATSAAQQVAAVQAQAAKEAAATEKERLDAQKESLTQARGQAESLFKFLEQYRGRNNPFVSIFSEAAQAADDFKTTAADLRKRFGDAADEAIGKLEKLTEAKRAALAEQGLGQRFEDRLGAQKLMQEAEALRTPDVPRPAQTPAAQVQDLARQQHATTATAFQVLRSGPPALQDARGAVNAYFGPDSPFAPKPEMTPAQRAALAAYGDLSDRQSRGLFVGNPAVALAGEFKQVSAAEERAAFLRMKGEGRIVADFAAAYRTDTAAGAGEESRAVRNARDAAELIRQTEAEAIAAGISPDTARRLADEQTFRSLRGGGVSAEDLAGSSDLRDFLASAMERSAGRLSSREGDARRQQMEDALLSAGNDLKSALESLTGAVKSGRLVTVEIKGDGYTSKVHKSWLGDAW